MLTAPQTPIDLEHENEALRALAARRASSPSCWQEDLLEGCNFPDHKPGATQVRLSDDATAELPSDNCPADNHAADNHPSYVIDQLCRKVMEHLGCHVFLQDEVARMPSVADYAAIAIERIRLLETAAQHARAAEIANDAKSRFLASVSHELRTPMTAILGMTDLALAEELPPAARGFIETVKSSADLLLQLLNSILDFSRIESGQFELERVAFDLPRIVRQAADTLRGQAARKGLELHCGVAPDVPLHVLGDPLRLEQVLMNLLGNALKFTHRGSVSVRVESVPPRQVARPKAERTIEGETGGMEATVSLRFSVCDTGIGIAAEEQDRIFSPFTQADASMSRRYGGTGLGLAISQRLVTQMGGSIALQSRPGKGSTFAFTIALPRAAEAPGDPPSAARAKEAMAPCPAAALRVLLAEDTDANQRLVSYLLAKRGHVVEIAADGRQAVARLKQGRFDVVLMDVQMPIMDGFQATAAIRKLAGKKARVPIIAMTAHACKGDKERCLAAGMDEYLSKPIGCEELIAAVERLGGEGKARGPASLPLSDSPSPPRCDLDAALARLGGEQQFFQEMVGFFFRDAPDIVGRIRSALRAGNAKALEKSAHRLKGTALYLGADSVADAIAAVETLGREGKLRNAAKAVRTMESEVRGLRRALRDYAPLAAERAHAG